MKFINHLLEEIMPKRGETKFMTTNKISHWNKYEVIDNVQ